MRLAQPEHFEDGEKIIWVKYEKPIIIPRLPVITNDKQRDKLIKTIETYIRSSLEYRDFIKYLKTNVDMNSCEFFHNLNAGSKKGLLEIHHEPYDLYTITSIVMNRHEAELGYIDELMVAQEVMKLHYEGLVGLVPLAITPHELVHKGKLAIPLNCVYGKFVEFTNRYFDYIDEAYITLLLEKVELTKKSNGKDFSILNVKYVYTDIDGYKLPHIIEDNDVA